MTNHDKKLELAMKLVAADNDHADPCVWLNGYCFDLTAVEDMELLRTLALHEPIRDQLEEFAKSLADCLKPKKTTNDQFSEVEQAVRCEE